jgi:predicted XRE-type DNA-binding protein
MKKKDARWNDTRITESSGNVFLDLGFPPEEAALLAMRADLMAKLRLTINENGWTQAEATKVPGIAQSRVSNLVRGSGKGSAWPQRFSSAHSAETEAG